MILNVCCSGSSGSTLLSFLLDRHPHISCGQELGLFSKPVFYENYYYAKKWSKLIKKYGISSNPLCEDRTILKNTETYKISKEQAWEWVEESNDINELANKFKKHVLQLTKKVIWAEKTPENIFTIDKFRKRFPDDKIIHIVRDPRDVVLSLMNRGYTALSAAEVWLTSVAAIQNYRRHHNVLEVRYEDLILNAKKTLESICNHLAVEYKMEYFLNDKYASSTIKKFGQLDSWRLAPSEGFSDKSIGKYKQCSVDLSVIFAAKLTKDFAKLINTKQFSLLELAQVYGYDFTGSITSEFRNIPVDTRARYKLMLSITYSFIDIGNYMAKIAY